MQIILQLAKVSFDGLILLLFSESRANFGKISCFELKFCNITIKADTPSPTEPVDMISFQKN